MHQRAASRSSGMGLVVVVSTMAVCALLVTLVFAVTSAQQVSTRRASSRVAAKAYADGVIESLYDQWRSAMIGVTASADRLGGLSDASLAATLVAPTSAQLPPPAGVTLGAWSVTARTPLLAPTTDPGGRPTPENGTSSSLRVRLNYLASVTVNYSTPAGQASMTMQRVFVRAGKNLFDNFFFGTQAKTEFHPGPDMYVSGTVYVGGDLFTAHNSLHFMRDVTLTGTHTLNYRSEDSRFGTSPTITGGGLGDNWDLNNPPRIGQTQKLFDTPTSSLDANFLDDPISNDTDSDGNPNNDGYRELIEERTGAGTDPLQLDTATSERLASNSDYRIYVDAANNVSIYRGTSTTPLGAATPEFLAISGALTLNRALRDVREGDNVRLVTMDVGQIKNAKAAGTISDNVGAGDGLMLYVRDTSHGTSVSTNVVNSSTGAATAVTSSRMRGVKLTNGAALPAGGLTVVSPNTVYIQGDYNTGSSGGTQPASNTTTTYTPPVDTPSPVVVGYQRQAAAVVGDAVNILSNAWNDANSLLGIGSRNATSTTVNTAIMAGNVPTTSSSYSGGIENFTRFHENWTGDYLTIYGALALLYSSAQATRPWSASSYSPPNRRWYYDTLFQNTNPPGFRVARIYERGTWLHR
jgi:hypothetical protein